MLRAIHLAHFSPLPCSDLGQGVAISTTAFMLPRFFVQTPMFSVSPSSFSLSERLSRRYCNKHHHQAMSLSILCCTSMTDFVLSVCACGLEVTVGISEASKRVPTFSFATHGGKQVSSHFRQGNWDKTSRLRHGISEASKRVPIFFFAPQVGFEPSEASKRVSPGRQAREFPFSTGELGQNFKAQTRHF